MKKHHYLNIERYQQAHMNFIDKVSTYAAKIKPGDRISAADVYRALKAGLANHIECQDRYCKYFTDQNFNN